MNFRIDEQLAAKKGKIVWLASYMKSGNTWLRAFLTGLLSHGEVYINSMIRDAYFPARYVFDNITDINSAYLTHDEIRAYRLDCVNYLVRSPETTRALFIKIHDKFEEPPYHFITPENTQAIIYIVRNPLDIASSLANHLNINLDLAIEAMNRPYDIATQKNGLHLSSQFKQTMDTWSNNVLSWKNNSILPIHLVRYEDMKNQPIETFSNIVKAIGLEVKEEDVLTAIEAASFNKLKEQEANQPFREANPKAKLFFRKGKTAEWKKELSIEQQQLIIEHHKDVMKSLGYI